MGKLVRFIYKDELHFYGSLVFVAGMALAALFSLGYPNFGGCG